MKSSNKKMPHYYSEKQESPLRLRKIKANLRGIEFEFYSGSGVFSKKKIDKGTALLAESMIVKKDAKVLDIGCGIGVLGIIVGKAFPETEVVMTDVNRRAYHLAKMNIELNKVFNADVLRGDLYEEVEGKFDVILVNPPQTAGKKICFEIVSRAKEHLVKGGLLELVARHNKGGIELGKKMREVFGNVKETAKKGGYRVYVSSNLLLGIG